MVKKKVKSARAPKRRGDVTQLEDVQVNTGLPPQVDGQLRCFCRVSVTQITWNVPNTPDVTYVQLKWWGEPGNGVLFRPVDHKSSSSSQTKTTARFPVRSGPKQFASYLNDMGSLIMEVLSGTMQVPIGTVEVPHLGQLAPNRPINGIFPVISPTEEKIGELHISLVMESLMASYDSTGSIPTTDVSMETYTSHVTQESTYPKQSQPVPHADLPRKPVDDPFISPASHMAVDSRLQNGYAEDLRQQLRYETDPVEKQYQPLDQGSTVAITTNGDVVRTNSNTENARNTKGNQPPDMKVGGQGNSDLLSVLLDRGNKLRQQMIISALESKPEAPTAPQAPRMEAGVAPPAAANVSISNDASFLRELMKTDQIPGGYREDNNLDEAAVDLVFGGSLIDDIKLLKNLHGSPNNSISGDDDILSDNEDPVHNESILNELFYKNLASSDGLSDLSADETVVKKHQKLEDESNMRPPSRSSSVSSLNLAFPEPEPKPSNKVRTPKRKSRVKLKRKGSKKRKGSRSRSGTRVSDCSDSEALSTASTPRSESSRVSFDMVPSDIDEPPSKDEVSRPKHQSVDGLSVERLTLLGRVSVARVTLEHLQLLGHDLDVSVKKTKPKKPSKYVVKPPRPSPKAKKSCTYFIEYQFPVVATSRDKYSPNTMATEVMRVVSRNVKNGVVGFNHRSVFPVMFDGNAVERWWKSALVFKIFSRTAGQKVPTLIGSCGIPLKSILRSESLYIGRDMEVRQSLQSANSSINTSLHTQDGMLGTLKLVIELASDSKEFPTQLAKTKLAELTGKAKIVPIAASQSGPTPQPAAHKPPPAPQGSQKPQVSEAASGTARRAESRSPSRSPQRRAEPQHLSVPQQVSIQHYHGDQMLLHQPGLQSQQDVGETMTLHALLMIPEGRNISMQGVPSLASAKRRPVFMAPTALTAPGVRARDLSVRNSYLVCRMFWCDESVHSAVCWGTSEPQFNFSQVAPVLMSQSLLERLKNNFMIVEVWDKKTSADNDKLVGIVKLSLHQFYMSFRDKRISSALLKSQYPVIAVENQLPIVDPFSGSQFGQLNVLLAMGSAEQVALLTRMKTEGATAVSGPQRPQHYLERQDLLNQGETVPAQIGTECVVEHVFEIVVEGIRGLSLFETMIWGEADCFVQYHFPAQQQTSPPGAPVIRHAVPTMKAFRTATTLCIADPTFHDVTRHRILLPQGTPVQRELLTACANTGGGAGNLPFELWCRFYHPNVRDQCIAKSSLPLAKLCAMITMQKRGEPSIQTFSFPLTHVQTDDQEAGSKSKSMDAGLMDITIHYKSQVVQMDQSSVAAANKNLSGAQVCISVGVIRASGLKTAAESVAHMDQGMQYPAEVGVNTYIRVKLSFLGSEGERITRTVARSFSPEFSHFMDFPCPLLWTEADTDAMCLAEMLETAEAVFEVWHQVPGLSSDLDKQLSGLTAEGVVGRQMVEKTGDVLLGSLTLPLVSLLSHRTGISGWYPVNIPVSEWARDQPEGHETQPRDDQGTSGLRRVGGGLELSIKFAHHEDRERVIHAARGVGWSPVDLDVEQDEWESEDEESNRYHHVNITIDHVTFPLQNALIAGQSTLDRTAKCYIRYKFYDKAAVMTKLTEVSVNSSGYITSKPRNKHDLQLPDSSTFRWYMREERLEMQVWISYGHHPGDQERPKHRDKLIGSAYINLEALSDPRRKQHRISGMYPLVRPGSASMGGGYVRAHIIARPQFGKTGQGDSQEGLITLNGEDQDAEYDPDDSFHQIVSHTGTRCQSPVKEAEPGEEAAVETESTFTVIIQVERALHLPLMKDKQKNQEFMPNTYVSYPTAESTIQSYTSVFHNSDNPMWDHEHETKLSMEMLQQDNKHLVLKVWHKPDAAPKSPDKLTDRVLGFVSVDLTPLANGLQQISGWYNIMDFNGQVKGQIKINVIPQQSVISTPGGQQGLTSDPTSYPPCADFLSLPVWDIRGGSGISTSPLSLPAFGSSVPDNPYQQVQRHHEELQKQLQEHIQQFLRHQEESQSLSVAPVSSLPSVTQVSESLPHVLSSVPEPASVCRERSIHWNPNLPQYTTDDSSSRSYLFTSLRKNLQDLDEITNNMKSKLNMKGTYGAPSQPTDLGLIPEFHIPSSSQAGNFPLTSTQSTLSSFDLPRSQRDTPRDELTSTGEQGAESSRTGCDSGAFSNEKFEDSVPTSHRSEKAEVTPRELLITADSGINQSGNNSNCEELVEKLGLMLSPRESHEKKDEYSESGGFSYIEKDGHYTPRDFLTTPRDGGFTPRDSRLTPRERSSFNGTESNGHLVAESSTVKTKEDTDENEVTQNQKQMSIIQEFSEGDGSDSEEEGGNRYYHRYRDMLSNEDEAEKSGDEEEGDDEEEEEEGEIVVPKRINDVSGKFSPTGEIIVLDPEFNKSVPYGSLFASRHSTKHASEHARENHRGDVELKDVSSDDESERNYERNSRNLTYEDQSLDKRDSWLMDSDKENDEEDTVIQGYQYMQHQGQFQKTKHQRQDSDTGYSSRDNYSESYMTPSGGGTNSETDMSRLHEHEHWEQRDSEEHAFQEPPKRRLLSKVELESTSGSIGLKTDSGRHSCISSAGSRQRKSSEPSIAESYENEEDKYSTENKDGQNLRSKSEELNNFFSAEVQKAEIPNRQADINSESDEDDSDEDSESRRVPHANRNPQYADDSGDEEPRSGERTARSQDGDPPVPNFFMPVKHLEESLRTLQVVTNKPYDPDQEREKAQAASEMMSRLTRKDRAGQPGTKPRLPTAEEAKRIAKIFSSKFS